MEQQHASSLDAAPSVHALSDDELLARLDALVGESHGIEADMVAHIGEVDERKLYARFAFSSMFVYCTERLHLSEAAAYRRITVARCARECPAILSALRDGRVHLSGLATLAPLLTPANCSELLARATHRTKRQIEELVATLAPRPDVRSGIRRLPERSTQDRSNANAATRESDPPDEAAAVELVPGRVGLAVPANVPAVTSADAPLAAWAPPSRLLGRESQPVLRALSPGRYKVQFTASDQLRDKLERLAAMMRAEVPDGDLATIIDRAVSEKLERLEARRFAKTTAPRKTVPQTHRTSASRYIPAAVRRAVAERDGGRCRYVDEHGRRCSERQRLEFHHRHPYGMGGDHCPDNIRLMCPTHNRYLAEHDYGSAAIRSRAASQRPVPLADPHT